MLSARKTSFAKNPPDTWVRHVHLYVVSQWDTWHLHEACNNNIGGSFQVLDWHFIPYHRQILRCELGSGALSVTGLCSEVLDQCKAYCITSLAGSRFWKSSCWNPSRRLWSNTIQGERQGFSTWSGACPYCSRRCQWSAQGWCVVRQGNPFSKVGIFSAQEKP